MAEKTEKKSIPSLDIKAPFYAAVGVGDLAVAAVNDIVEKIRETAENATSEVLAKVNEARGKHLPEKAEKVEESDIRDLVTKFSPEELRKVAEAYSKVALDIFNLLAERGEEATKRLLKQSDVESVKKTVTDKVEEAKTVVADKVDEVRELTDEALGKVASGTRALGEQVTKTATSTTRRATPAKKDDSAAK
ncbi:MAG: heparin-binding hemagglutinin [Segniliparus sp.]|uniref:heparin-binding hemagglutinin n=1 Tax=Segniliparus sp. TaxID=2804064 RepID=UPI003F373D7C